jgi:hypothetical protein
METDLLSMYSRWQTRVAAIDTQDSTFPSH